MAKISQLEYYQQNNFNPVPIDLEDGFAWDSHFAIRRNLYEGHLRIPFGLLRDASVLEFGCNSGENALVLASVGANLTLVEPNGQVLPRLHAQFEKYGVHDRIVELVEQDITEYKSSKLYDLIIVEGFLYTLPNRDELIQKISDLLVPGGLAIVSFDDRYGSLPEMTKRMVQWRACEIAGITDMHGQDSLELAQRLFATTFAELKGARLFDVWWKDVLLSPTYSSEVQWSYPELLTLLRDADCEFYSSSPSWSFLEGNKWYKNISTADDLSEQLLHRWARTFAYFLTGFAETGEEGLVANAEVIGSVSTLVEWMSAYSMDEGTVTFDTLKYPQALGSFLESHTNPSVKAFNSQLKGLCEVAVSGGLDDLVQAYHSGNLHNTWGTPLHYMCFKKKA